MDKNSTVLFLKGYDWNDMQWLELAEDYSKYNSAYIGQISPNSFSFISGMITSHEQLPLLNIEHSLLPASWALSNDELVKSCKTSSPRCMYIGAKGVGKSTCLRYSINRLLSKYKAVCVIDYDVGQPELSLPGMLSLHVIRSPILVPNYMNIHAKPECAFYLGDVTSKSNPTLVASYVKVNSRLNKYNRTDLKYIFLILHTHSYTYIYIYIYIVTF